MAPAGQPVGTEPGDFAGGHTRLRLKGWGSPNSDDWRRNLALCLLCGEHPPRICWSGESAREARLAMLGGEARLPTVTQLVSRAQVSTASWLKDGPPTGLTPYGTRTVKRCGMRSRSCQVFRVSDFQSQSRNSPGFNLGIL
jgi:hypothetical protein